MELNHQRSLVAVHRKLASALTKRPSPSCKDCKVLREMLADVTKRPFVILGMIGFLVMIPLALTSWNGAIRRMGAVAWSRLHKLAYVAILAGAVHLVLLSKVWTTEVLVYLGLSLGLLAFRLVPKGGMRRRAAA